jgi:hypothetical protein
MEEEIIEAAPLSFIRYQSFGLHEVKIERRYLERNRQGSQFKQRQVL